jgi:hypothetical protein
MMNMHDTPDELVIAREVDGTITASVEHKEVRHSETGFEVGYEGSGSADLALNILFDVTGAMPPPFLYQAFKRVAIAKIVLEPGQRIVLSRSDIRTWYELMIEHEYGDGTELQFDLPKIEGPGT